MERWVLIATVLAAMAACSGDRQTERLEGVADEDRREVDVATNRQIQIGFQITSFAQQENAMDLCFEMCGQSAESCDLASNVCNVAKRYPETKPLKARCDVTRERCRVHRTKVPRQCPCER